MFSIDPQGFGDLLGTMPWHADTILQVSEVYRHREGNPTNPVISHKIISTSYIFKNTHKQLIL